MTLTETVDAEVLRAFPAEPGAAPDRATQLRCLRRLHEHYMRFFAGPAETHLLGDWDTPAEVRAVEEAWNAYEERLAAPALNDLPTTAAEFADWFLELAVEHEYTDVCDYLRHEATALDVALLVLAEDKVDSRFDDLMAVAQLGTSGLTKMTIAHNYWDEMGEGDHATVHTTLFDQAASWMREEVLIPSGFPPADLDFAEAYGDACNLLMYNLRRRYSLRGLASLGLLEQTAPARFAATVAACERLGLPEHVTGYQRLHAHMDVDHSREWVDGVFIPIAERNPELIPELAMGVIIRGNVASRFFHTLQDELFGRG